MSGSAAASIAQAQIHVTRCMASFVIVPGCCQCLRLVETEKGVTEETHAPRESGCGRLLLSFILWGEGEAAEGQCGARRRKKTMSKSLSVL